MATPPGLSEATRIHFEAIEAKVQAEFAQRREQEIRRMARDFLMQARDLRGTREDALRNTINKATIIYDDVESAKIEPKGVLL